MDPGQRLEAVERRARRAEFAVLLLVSALCLDRLGGVCLLCADTAAGAPPAEFPGSNESEYENEFQA